jgi:hypothetical protein
MIYQPEFAVGDLVRVADRSALQQFLDTWQFHDPLTREQLEWAARTVRVTAVGIYHGGDELYTLENVPGIWHERLLSACHPPDGSDELERNP